MSGLPPTIDSHTLPKTPADEWANNTTNALDSSHVSNRDPSIPHFASTGAPDKQLPGAFPRGADLSAPPTPEDTKRSVQGMVGTAKHYVPGQQDVQRAIQNVSDTAKQYLPESIGSYLPGSNQTATSNASALPSKEVPGGSNVGVGSLPGSNSEASVAKLPEERAQDGTAQDHTGILESAKQHIPTTQGIGETAKKYAPQSMAAYLPGSTPAKDFSLPSTETPSGAAGGVGSLPGTASEVSVAKLPEERFQERFPTHETDHELLGKTGGVGALPGGPNESGVALLPEERVHGEDRAGILESAKQYIPTTQGIGETAKKYVPQSIAAYLPGSAPAKDFSLPSTETPSGSAGGVGSLPGTASEVSVAKLPEERLQEGLPSHETDHERLGKTGGVGALPGGPNESSVALLPEERVHGEDDILRSSSGGKGTGTGANAPVTTTTNTLLGTAGAAPQTQSGIPATQVSPAGTGIGYSNLGHTSNGTVPADKITQTTQDIHTHTQPESKTQKAKEGAQEVKGKVASALPGHSGETGLVGAKGSDTSTTPTTAAASSTTSSPAAATTTTQPGTEDQTNVHRASTGSADTHHKVGFMDKMKGEAMVISGKLGKNEKKVEEGRHLMGKA